MQRTSLNVQAAMNVLPPLEENAVHQGMLSLVQSHLQNLDFNVSDEPKLPSCLPVPSRRGIDTGFRVSGIPLDWITYEAQQYSDGLTVQIQTCGHFLHQACFEVLSSYDHMNAFQLIIFLQRYMETNREHMMLLDQSNVLNLRRNEFQCPMCRRRSNALLPVPPTLSQIEVCALPACFDSVYTPLSVVTEVQDTPTKSSQISWSKSRQVGSTYLDEQRLKSFATFQPNKHGVA